MYIWEFMGNILGIVHVYMGTHGKFIVNSTCIYGSIIMGIKIGEIAHPTSC
jgi:hypothetical protein